MKAVATSKDKFVANKSAELNKFLVLLMESTELENLKVKFKHEFMLCISDPAAAASIEERCKACKHWGTL